MFHVKTNINSFELFNAIHAGNLSLLKKCIKKDPSLLINEQAIPNLDGTNNSLSLLACASKKGQLVIVEYLLTTYKSFYKKGKCPDLTIATIKNMINTALVLAANNGHFVVVERLLKEEQVDQNQNGYQAIDEAYRNNHLALAQFLVEDQRIMPNRLFVTVCSRGQLWIVDILLKNLMVNPAFNNNAAILAACKGGHLTIVERLLQNSRVNPSVNNNESLRIAYQNKNLDIVKRLLHDPRIDPSFDENWLFREVCKNCKDNQEEIVNLLLKDQRVISTKPQELIRILYNNKQFNIVKRLLQDPRIDPSFDENWLLCEVCKNCKDNQEEIVNLLLKDQRVVSTIANSPVLQIACQYSTAAVVQRLLENKQIQHSEDQYYAAMRIAQKNNLDIIGLLLNDPRVNPAYNNNAFLYDVCNYSSYWTKINTLSIIEMLLKHPRITLAHKEKQAIHKAIYEAYIPICRESNFKISSEYLSLTRLLQDPRLDPFASVFIGRYAQTFSANWLLCKACEAGDEQVFKILLEHPLLNPTCASYAAIDAAYKFDRYDMLASLLKHETVEPIELYQWAHAKGHEYATLVKIILQTFTVVPGFDNHLLLYTACKTNDAITAQILLENCNITPLAKREAFYIACEHVQQAVVSMLLKDPQIQPTSQDLRMAYSNITRNTNNYYAAAEILVMLLDNDHIDARDKESIIQDLLKDHRDFNFSLGNNWFIRYAARNDILQILLEDDRIKTITKKAAIEIWLKKYEVDVTFNNNYLLRYAVQKGFTEIVETLLQNKTVDPTVNNNESIQVAYYKGYFEIVGKLLNDARICQSCQEDNLEMFKTLLEDPQVIFILEDSGIPPLIKQIGSIAPQYYQDWLCREGERYLILGEQCSTLGAEHFSIPEDLVISKEEDFEKEKQDLALEQYDKALLYFQAAYTSVNTPKNLNEDSTLTLQIIVMNIIAVWQQKIKIEQMEVSHLYYKTLLEQIINYFGEDPPKEIQNILTTFFVRHPTATSTDHILGATMSTAITGYYNNIQHNPVLDIDQSIFSNTLATSNALQPSLNHESPQKHTYNTNIVYYYLALKQTPIHNANSAPQNPSLEEEYNIVELETSKKTYFVPQVTPQQQEYKMRELKTTKKIF